MCPITLNLFICRDLVSPEPQFQLMDETVGEAYAQNSHEHSPEPLTIQPQQ